MKLLAKINKFLPSIKKSSDLNAFNNVLVVSNSGLGDTILSTPAIISLRRSHPNINITFLINKKMYPLFEGFEFIDGFIQYSSGLISQIRLIKEVKKKNIDTIFLFHSNGPEDIFFSVLSGATNILKMTYDPDHEFKKFFLNKCGSSLKHYVDK
jgi:ADP-heptose:LPS heptosyltransferase